MTAYTFQQLVDNPTIGDIFNPATDTLVLDAAATEVTVFVRPSQTEIQKTINGTLYSIKIAATADQFDSGTLMTTGGIITFGDDNNAVDGDPLGNSISGDSINGSQYFGLSGADTFFGGTGDDIVYGNKDNDYILGGGGADLLYGGQGDDYVSGYLRLALVALPVVYDNQVIYGNLGSDTMISSEGDDVHYGGQGNDLIWSYGGSDVIYGNKGDDTIAGGSMQNVIYGGQGNDSVVGGAIYGGSQVIYGNLDADTIGTGWESDTVYGGQGDDVITVNSGAGNGQLIRGNKDNDLIDASKAQGNDTLEGGAGDDTILAGAGSDVVVGGSGNDSLVGGNSASSMEGGAGDDVIKGGQAGDTLKGGSGNDTIYGGENLKIDTLYGGTPEFIHGEGGDDVIYLGGNANLGVTQSVLGGAGNDSIESDAGANMLVGGSGSDTIVAGWYASDTMDGGVDNDMDVFVWGSRNPLNATQYVVNYTQASVALTPTHHSKRTDGFTPNPGNVQFFSINSSAHTGKMRFSANMTNIQGDVVNNFVAGQDRLAFDPFNLLYRGSANAHVAVGTSGGGGGSLALLSIVTMQRSTSPVSNVGLIGKYSNSSALLSDINNGRLATNGTFTGAGNVLAFAANSAATRLWVLTLRQSNTGVQIDGGAVLGTIRIAAGIGGNDIYLDTLADMYIT